MNGLHSMPHKSHGASRLLGAAVSRQPVVLTLLFGGSMVTER